METLFIVAGITAIIFVIFGILGSILNFATNAIRTLFSLALIAGVIFAGFWFFNGQTLPF